jgi:hypothetical protein
VNEPAINFGWASESARRAKIFVGGMSGSGNLRHFTRHKADSTKERKELDILLS